MSLTPWFGGRRHGGIRDWDLWDPLGIGQSGWGLDRGYYGRDRDDDITALAHANVDWRETDNAHIFRVDLPGVRKEEVKVHVEDGNILQISGEKVKEEEEEEENDKWHRAERRRGSFVRRFRLPEDAKLDDIKAKLENGVLDVVVPKKESGEKEKNVKYIDIA